MPLKLKEKRYHAERGDSPDAHQTLEVIQEAPEPSEVNGGRQYIRFSLMEQRWRSKREAASYLRWAAKEIEQLPE